MGGGGRAVKFVGSDASRKRNIHSHLGANGKQSLIVIQSLAGSWITGGCRFSPMLHHLEWDSKLPSLDHNGSKVVSSYYSSPLLQPAHSASSALNWLGYILFLYAEIHRGEGDIERRLGFEHWQLKWGIILRFIWDSVEYSPTESPKTFPCLF